MKSSALARLLQNHIDVELAIEHSYRDFHAKGLDYICVRRSDELTVKLYFFDGDTTKLPDVVHPHDHRYAFNSWVVVGRMQNSLYEESEAGQTFQRFSFDTPLNGGRGFEWRSEVRLLEIERRTFG